MTCSAGSLFCSDEGKPDQQLQGSLRVRHSSAARDKCVHLLTRETEQTSQVRLVTIFALVRSQLRAHLIPQRRASAGTERAPARGWLASLFQAKSAMRMLGQEDSGFADEFGEIVVKIQAGMRRSSVIHDDLVAGLDGGHAQQESKRRHSLSEPVHMSSNR